MGYEYGDAQNTAVRVLLTQFSKRFKYYFDQYYLQKTLAYFGGRCPYTGEVITRTNSERDHIVPLNRESCGLHVFGNVLVVTRSANSQKGSKSLEEFLKNEPEKLARIKRFIRESGYEDLQRKYGEKLKKYCNDIYNNVGTMLRSSCDNLFESCGIDYYTQAPEKKVIFEPKRRKVARGKNNSLSKEEIVSLCRKNGVNIGPVHNKAAKNNWNKFWVNPSINNLEHDWWLSLDDCENKILYCFNIPAHSISENQIVVRNDKKYLIDLQIYNEYNFVDARSGLSFAQWLVKTIRY